MKCNKRVFFVVGAVLFLASCSSTNMKNESSDVYDSEVTDENSDIYEIKTDKEGKTKSAKKSTGNILADMFSSKYEEIGDGSLFTPKALGGIKQQACVYEIYAKTETAGFGSSYMASYYHVTFDDANRISLLNSMERYLNDFENKKLSRSDKKSGKTYGKVKAIIRWGTIKDNNPYYASDCTLTLGYKFVDNSPYFTITMEPVVSESVSIVNSADDVIYSLRLNYHFTKAQCRMMIDGISDKNVGEAMYENEILEVGEIQEVDTYE